MERIRLVLIVIGIIVLLVIYLLGRWQYRRRTAARLPDDEEVLNSDEVLFGEPLALDDSDVEQELAGLERMMADDRPAPGAAPTAGRKGPAVGGEGKIVVLHVVAPEGRRFAGGEVKRSFEDEQLTFGDMNIYHRLVPIKGKTHRASASRPVFSVASLTEPGTFNPGTMAKDTVKGFTLFMQLPGPIDGCAAFDSMLSSAEHLAAMLNGRVWDSTHSTLNPQMVQHIRDDIRGYEYHQKYQKGA